MSTHSLADAPNASAFPRHAASVRGLCATKSDTCLKHAEQLSLACDFYTDGLLHTLPCSYLYDLATPRYAGYGAPGFRNCLAFSKMGRKNCTAIVSHVQQECAWRQVHSRVHVVHFKGRIKPWVLNGKTRCRDIVNSRPRRLALENASTAAPYTGPDDLVWSDTAASCLSRRRGLRVVWTDGSALAKECCQINVALGVEWRALRRDFCDEMQRTDPNGKRSLPSPDCRRFRGVVSL